jgi:hypothetical protein
MLPTHHAQRVEASASELAAAAKGYGELLAAGLVTQAAHDEQLELLRAEATALLAAPRARSSTGDAGSPAPTIFSSDAANLGVATQGL